MAKRPPVGKCVHCLANNVHRTWDHVFPRAWYPDTTPQDMQKWQIPTCQPCNHDYGKIEEDLLFRLALCVDPHVPETSGIVQKVLRSMKPEHAKNERDKAFRSSRAARLKGLLLNGADIPRSAVYPGIGERWGRSSQEGLGLFVPANSVRRLAEKIVRGIYYLQDNRTFIEPPYSIDFYALDDDGAEPLRALLDQFGQTYAREPGIVVRRVVPEDAPLCGVFEINIWGQFKMYASVDSEP
jgi:hypothetical protein